MCSSDLELLTESGLTPMQALVAATRDAADVIGQGRVLGTVEAGKLADLLVVDGDPLRDIAHIRRLEKVLRGGVVHVPSELSAN